MWDVLHPGRTWAEKLKPAMTVDEVLGRVREFLEAYKLPSADFNS